jgi:hypothetical protein
MQINLRLIKYLMVTSTVSFVALVGVLVAASINGAIPLPAPTISILSGVLFMSLFWQWGYWIFYFRRTGQRRELWLCYCIPYFYAAYRAVAALRAHRVDAA